MKKRCMKLFLLVAALSMAMPVAAFAEEKAPANAGSAADLAPSARSAILMDADSGTIIYEKNSNDKLPPASITKVMTMLLIMEAIDDGTIKLTDKVQASEYASSMGGSQIFLEPGEEMTVDDMIKGIALASGNDASVAMAEKLAGTEQQFVAKMNEKAQQLGLKETHFANCNGLPTTDHYSSAHDIAVMSRELLKHSEITKYTGLYQDYLRKTSEKPFWLVNTNKLVRFYSGADGLKTGFTSEAKFCLSATARRDDLRIIAVVMGEPNTKTRNNEVAQMFDYAFAQYMTHSIFKEGDTMGNVNIEKGTASQMPIVAKHQYSVLLKKGTPTTDIRYELQLEPLKAPVKIGQPIGKLIVFQGDQVLKEFPVDAPQSIDRAGWWKMLQRSLGGLFT
ncbi:D-alanyl-D-alanine carboxypeptidase family protein [Paenibacillus radicis (ex Gao et al. 2016)]|uniref:serine-type D-Ala-D-Ala carboxypeptidase n=1 Tax=Paenibacillus radicis (ex Gao et al. 2016) TaxID=1737354 RepID=A0A917LTN3_9BACL|nr:D-alanyl-D-alanine carboxypeptidase family protein [Paenibacillus radicis (ex Gao et al. 2016)]GGG57167.1 D-alanyl-D-alanine carboxypeptidase [Paenibacillus radicis (ex Gao et al. 2016)]